MRGESNIKSAIGFKNHQSVWCILYLRKQGGLYGDWGESLVTKECIMWFQNSLSKRFIYRAITLRHESNKRTRPTLFQSAAPFGLKTFMERVPELNQILGLAPVFLAADIESLQGQGGKVSKPSCPAH